MPEEEMPYVLSKAVKSKNWTYDAYRLAGSDKRWTYFRMLHKGDNENELNLNFPVYIAVNKKGQFKIVENYKPLLRAMRMEKELLDDLGKNSIVELPVIKGVPDIIQEDARKRGFTPYLAGTIDGIDYYYYQRKNIGHYCGLPAIVKYDSGVIIDVVNVRERLHAFSFAISVN